jgi:hypothetical protein
MSSWAREGMCLRHVHGGTYGLLAIMSKVQRKGFGDGGSSVKVGEDGSGT